MNPTGLHAPLVIKENWSALVNGRWRKMPNRYHLRTVEEALAASIAARDKPKELAPPAEPEIMLGEVSLPPCEATFPASARAIADSFLTVQPKEVDNVHEGLNIEAADGTVLEVAARATGGATGDSGRCAGAVPILSRRSEAELLPGGVLSGSGADIDGDARESPDLRKSMGQIQGDPGSYGTGSNGATGRSWVRLAPDQSVTEFTAAQKALAERRQVIEARMLNTGRA